MTLEEWEMVRFYLVLFGSLFTIGSLLASAYITIKKPGVQATI